MARVRALSPFAAFATVGTLLLTTMSTGACAKLHARTIGPALTTPPPPPRVVPAAKAPIESQPIVASPPVGEVPATTPPSIKPSETPPPAAPSTPAAAAPTAGTERPAPTPERPPTLQTTTDTAVAEQRTRAALANATRDLGRIDVRRLSADGKAQYDIARRFVAQANSALSAGNFEFAQQLADKAATLAALLQKR